MNVGGFKTQLVEEERVQQGPRPQFFFAFLFLRKISDSVNPSDLFTETLTSATSPTLCTSSFSTSAPLSASLSHTSLSSTNRSGSSIGNSSPLFPTVFSQGASMWRGETAVSLTLKPTTDPVSAWDELMSASRMTLFSDIVQVQRRRTWLLIGELLIFFQESGKHLILN